MALSDCPCCWNTQCSCGYKESERLRLERERACVVEENRQKGITGFRPYPEEELMDNTLGPTECPEGGPNFDRDMQVFVDNSIHLVDFRLFDIHPVFDLKLGDSPGVPQKCSKGHRWNFGFSFIGIRLDLSSLGLTEGPEDYCFLCLRDLLREHCGRVKQFN